MEISKYVARSCKLAAMSLLFSFFFSWNIHCHRLSNHFFHPTTDNNNSWKPGGRKSITTFRISIPIIVIYANAIIARGRREVTMYPPLLFSPPSPCKPREPRSTGRYYLTISANEWSRVEYCAFVEREWNRSNLRIKLPATVIFLFAVIFTKGKWKVITRSVK